MIRRDEVVKAARTYLGVKFRMYGRDRSGVDCVGLLYCVMHDLGSKVEDFTNYTRGPEVDKLNNALDSYSYHVPNNPPRTGQVLKLRQFVFPMHTGILVIENGNKSVINANIKKGKVVEDSWNDWKQLVMEHREIRGVA